MSVPVTFMSLPLCRHFYGILLETWNQSNPEILLSGLPEPILGVERSRKLALTQ